MKLNSTILDGKEIRHSEMKFLKDLIKPKTACQSSKNALQRKCCTLKCLSASGWLKKFIFQPLLFASDKPECIYGCCIYWISTKFNKFQKDYYLWKTKFFKGKLLFNTLTLFQSCVTSHFVITVTLCNIWSTL